MTFDLSGYIDVAERITLFREQYPEGSLQSTVLRWPRPEEGFAFVAVEARAYRYPDDPRPGYGLAWEPFPGKTPYTKDSELQNAETSAWGRALVAVLAADTKKGISSRNEIESRRTSDSATPSHPKVAQVGRELSPSPPVAESATSAPAVIGSAGTAESGSGGVDNAREFGEGSTATAPPDPGQPKAKCLHLKGSKPRKMSSGRMREVCLECGAVLEEAAS